MVEKQLYGTVLLKSKKILDYISSRNEAPTLKQISDGVNIAKPTVFKILQTLEYCGFVRSSSITKQYYLGTALINYGYKAAQSFDISNIAMPFLNKLRDETTEAVNLGILENNRIILLNRAKSSNNIRFDLELGGAMEMYSSAMGKALLSTYSEEQLNRYLDQTALTPLTKNTITNREDLLEELSKIKQQGYALDNIENQEGIYCIGFPLIKNDHIFGAFSISAPVFRVDDDKIKNWIKLGTETKKEILARF